MPVDSPLEATEQRKGERIEEPYMLQLTHQPSMRVSIQGTQRRLCEDQQPARRSHVINYQGARRIKSERELEKRILGNLFLIWRRGSKAKQRN